jgi:hypothetical protein
MKPTYPKKDGDRYVFVRYPVQINRLHIEQQKKNNFPLVPFEEGKWMAVNVLLIGYGYLVAPVLFDDEATCQRACDRDNKFMDFTPEDVKQIVAESMELV